MSNKYFNQPDPSVLDNKYTNLPNEIHDHPTLGLTAKAALWNLLRYATCPNFTHTDSRLRKFLECGKNKLEKAFARAARAGFIHYEKVRGPDGKIVHTIRHFARYAKWSRNGEGVYACALCSDATCAFCLESNNAQAQNPYATRVSSTPIETMPLDFMAQANHGVLLNTDTSLSITDTSTSIVHSDDALHSFEFFWKEYPNKKHKKTALKAYRIALKKVDAQTLLVALRGYLAERKERVELLGWVAPLELGATWLNGERWENPISTKEDILNEQKEQAGKPRQPASNQGYDHKPIVKTHLTPEETRKEYFGGKPPAKDVRGSQATVGAQRSAMDVIASLPHLRGKIRRDSKQTIGAN